MTASASREFRSHRAGSQLKISSICYNSPPVKLIAEAVAINPFLVVLESDSNVMCKLLTLDKMKFGRLLPVNLPSRLVSSAVHPSNTSTESYLVSVSNVEKSRITDCPGGARIVHSSFSLLP